MPNTMLDESTEAIPSFFSGASPRSARSTVAPPSGGSRTLNGRNGPGLLAVTAKALRQAVWFLYGMQLLSPVAALWIVSTWLLVVSMAAVEGMTWAWMLKQMFSGVHATALALAAGGIWAVGVYLLDTNFCTMDTVPRPDTSASGSSGAVGAATAGGARSPMRAGVAVRVLMLGASMFIAGPNLSRMFEEHTVLDALHFENAQQTAAAVTNVRDQAAIARRKVRDELRQLEVEYQNEVTGRNGRPGDGPIARALLARVHAKEAELARLDEDTERTVQRIRQASPADLVREFGVKLLSDTPDTRATLHAKLEQENRVDRILGIPNSQLMASALMVLLFAGMLCLKLIWAPASARIYFSAFLQELFTRYKQGALDMLQQDILPAQCRAADGLLMGPIQWCGWVMEAYIPASHAIQQARAQGADLDRLNIGLKRIEARCAGTEAAIRDDNAHLRQLKTEGKVLETAIAAAQPELQAIDRAIEDSVRAPLRAQQAALQKDSWLLQGKKSANVSAIDSGLNSDIAETCTLIDRQTHVLGLTYDQVTVRVIEDDPYLYGLMERRKKLVDQKNSLHQENLSIDRQIAGLEDRLRKLEEEIAQNVDLRAHGLGSMSEQQRALHERRSRAMETLRQQTIRYGELESSISDLEDRATLSRVKLAADQQELARLWVKLRALERKVDEGGVGD